MNKTDHSSPFLIYSDLFASYSSWIINVDDFYFVLQSLEIAYQFLYALCPHYLLT